MFHLYQLLKIEIYFRQNYSHNLKASMVNYYDRSLFVFSRFLLTSRLAFKSFYSDTTLPSSMKLHRKILCMLCFFYKKAPLKLPSQIWCNFTISVLVWRQHKTTRLCDWPVTTTTTTSTTTRLFMLSLDIYNIQQKPIRPSLDFNEFWITFTNEKFPIYIRK